MRQATDPAKEASLDEKARQLAERERQFIESYRYELIGELPRLEGYARTALERATERFPSERTTARRFLEHDVPRRILWLSAVISFLENAPVRERYQFVKTDDWRATTRLFVDSCRTADSAISMGCGFG